MFKNALVFRLATGWEIGADVVEDHLQRVRFVPCAGSEEFAIGWVEPRGIAHGPLLESISGQWVLKVVMERRSVPASVLQRKLMEQVSAIEASTGRRPGKRELRGLKDDLRMQLLPMAFPKQTAVWVWIDREKGLLVLDTSSQARADEVLTLLLRTLPDVTLSNLETRIAPARAMADWLLAQEAPSGFMIDRECELRATDESAAVVRYTRHEVDTDEVRQHVQSGKTPTRLALTWNGRVSFVLTQEGSLRKIEFLEGVFDQADGDDRFDTDVVLSTSELRVLIPDLIEALGSLASAIDPTTVPSPLPVVGATESTMRR
ncbi:recombination-associated protein RdgC [Candidatus Symbiobacter mobilis]|uniref:Recombination-associated protein RdgC n=1 Tax=Candidatus Symbiobacter mobilis CR TaxID=946483 RepID=U5NBH9_9BURK|nr:recombination-associated protein RdgC [Candidatus Symbiobacter mobilis]AGX88675.1 recombination protein RdgC [Candidatus Symbiobacter mobilis CR]